jgi:hypothetical protein
MKKFGVIIQVTCAVCAFSVRAQVAEVEGAGSSGGTPLEIGSENIVQNAGVFRTEPSLKNGDVAVHAGPHARLAREHGLFIGVNAGISNVDPKNSSRNEEGISFDFTTEDDDLSTKIYFGYWINSHVGFEMGGVGLGNVTVPFNFSDPRNGRVGTGEAEVEINGTVGSILLAVDPIPGTQLYLRGGVNGWTRKLESRFDVTGEDSVRSSQERTGTGLVYGGGLTVNFQAGWHFRAEAEFYDVDGDSVSVYSAGLSYDFGPPSTW